MKQYFLQEGITETDYRMLKESRIFLDDHQHEGTKLISKIPASSWVAAREVVADEFYL